MKLKGYIGSIVNKGSQYVEAAVTMPSSKSPKVVTGGDLRTKPSNKKK